MVSQGLPLTLPEGWLSSEEADALRTLAAGRTVLELGAWKGRSTVTFGEVAEYVVSVDRHGGIGDKGDSLSEYLEAVRPYENVAIVRADFARFVPLLKRFGLVYVDGDHDASAVKADARLALKHVAPGGIVAFHDWDFPAVEQAASLVMRRVPIGLAGSVAWYRV